MICFSDVTPVTQVTSLCAHIIISWENMMKIQTVDILLLTANIPLMITL